MKRSTEKRPPTRGRPFFVNVNRRPSLGFSCINSFLRKIKALLPDEIVQTESLTIFSAPVWKSLHGKYDRETMVILGSTLFERGTMKKKKQNYLGTCSLFLLIFFSFLRIYFLFTKNESVKNICPLKMSSPSLHDAIALTFFSFESPTCMCALTCFCYTGKKNKSTTSRCTWQLHLPGYLLYDFMQNNPGPEVTWKLRYKKSRLRSTFLHDWF